MNNGNILSLLDIYQRYNLKLLRVQISFSPYLSSLYIYTFNSHDFAPPKSDNHFSCLCPSSFTTAHSCHLRIVTYLSTVILTFHSSVSGKVFSTGEPVPLRFAPLLKLAIIVFLFLTSHKYSRGGLSFFIGKGWRQRSTTRT